jgi:hypothetical protein
MVDYNQYNTNQAMKREIQGGILFKDDHAHCKQTKTTYIQQPFVMNNNIVGVISADVVQNYRSSMLMFVVACFQ